MSALEKTELKSLLYAVQESSSNSKGIIIIVHSTTTLEDPKESQITKNMHNHAGMKLQQKVCLPIALW